MGGCVKARTWNLLCKGLICLALGLITLAAFAPSLTHDFLAYDDQAYVTENPHVQAGLTWPGVEWAFRSYAASNWHPVTWLSHMLDCQLYGLRPAGHHLTNVLLHIANTLLLFLVLSRMTGALWQSAFVAALFAWHPLHVESVAWVAERKDLLGAFFWMLTLWAYARYVEVQSLKSKVQGLKPEGRRPKPDTESTPGCAVPSSRFEVQRSTFDVRPSSPSSILHLPSSIFYLLALSFFALGLMSKPMVVTLPFVLLLLDYWPLGRYAECGVRNAEPGGSDAQRNPSAWRRLVAEKIPFLALSAISCLLTIRAQQGSYSVVSVAGLPLSRRIPHALVGYAHYLGVMAVPRHLAAHYPYPAATSAAAVAGAGIVLALLSLLAFWLAARRPYLVVGWLWYLGTLVPVIGLVQVGDQAWADRYTYLPLVGLFVAIVWGVADLVQAKGSGAAPWTKAGRAVVGGVAVAIGLGLLAGTCHQLRYWKDTRTLFEHAAQVTRHNGRALTVLGSLLAKEGKLSEAMDLYAQALRYRSDNPEAHFCLGNAFEQQGKLAEAVAEYTQALWFKPMRERTHLALGLALAKQKNYEQAAAHDRTALAINPESAVAHNNLARLLHTQGRLDEAIEHYSAALKLDPKLAQAHNNLGVVLIQKGRLAEGAAHLQEAVRLNPADAESQYNLALALGQQEQWNQAAAIFSRLAPGRPNDPNLYYQFGLALAHLQRRREAMSHYAHSLVLQPDFPDALDRLAWILATAPEPEFRNGEQAVHLAERACELTGQKQARLLATLAAAYAEAGRFPEAVRTAERARELAAGAGQEETALHCASLLEAVKSGKSWQENPKDTAAAPPSPK
jgi:tetratricopeptide (TPR) repeat protein